MRSRLEPWLSVAWQGTIHLSILVLVQSVDNAIQWISVEKKTNKPHYLLGCDLSIEQPGPGL